jgi:endonuclease/exonuclease/phosphatase family metal-dependent hydrolase
MVRYIVQYLNHRSTLNHKAGRQAGSKVAMCISRITCPCHAIIPVVVWWLSLSMFVANAIQVILPGSAFGASGPGEVSVVSMNVLAPSYHYLSLVDPQERMAAIQHDRQTRVPLAFQMAKQTNADVLCLQEVEQYSYTYKHKDKYKDKDKYKYNNTHDETLESLLAPEYNAHFWSPLQPPKSTTDETSDCVVGLCVAWKSSKHRLVRPTPTPTPTPSMGYRRGMMVQLQDVETGTIMSIANLHLHAKASAIDRRLKTMAATIQRLQQQSTTANLSIIAGDFNCDPGSVTHRLATTGHVASGTLRERNYKIRLPRDVAKAMRHNRAFTSIYEGSQQLLAPITVSLTGRKPACMDHILFATTATSGIPLGGPSAPLMDKRKAKRLAQRDKGKSKATRRDAFLQQQQEEEETVDEEEALDSSSLACTPPTPDSSSRSRSGNNNNNNNNNHQYGMKVQAVLATVVPDDEIRLQMILKGLPNIEAGFPSDHLPIGALLVPIFSSGYTTTDDTNDTATTSTTATSRIRKEREGGDVMIPKTVQEPHDEPVNESANTPSTRIADTYTPTTRDSVSNNSLQYRCQGAISVTARRRRQAHALSVVIRQRHNVVLGEVAEWLTTSLGATRFIRDKPLREWNWFNDNGIINNKDNNNAPKIQLTNKLRAPDLCCVLNGNTLVIVEVTVGKSAKLEQLRKQKQVKYQDLASILRQSPVVRETGLSVADHALVVVLDNDGQVSKETLEDLQQLVRLAKNDDLDEKQITIEANLFAKHLQDTFADKALSAAF